MTYLERRIITASSSGKPSPAGSIAPNTNGSGRNPLGPRNSLDYWQKAEDRNGMSYYWNGPISKGLENVYAQHSPVPQQLRRPAPFPLTLPPSSGTPPSRSTTVSPLPTVYQNVPTMPRARLIQSSSRQNLSQPQTTVTQPSSAPKAPRDSPIFAAANGKPRDNMLVWSVTNQNGNPAGSGNPISSVPRYNQNNTTTIQIGGGMRQSSPKYGEKVKNSRQKPRWGRFMQSLCCCVVAPQRTAEKTAAQPHQNTSLLITQVQKNGSVSSAPSSDVVRPANDYSHTPVLQHHGANGTIVNGCASPQNGTIVPVSRGSL